MSVEGRPTRGRHSRRPSARRLLLRRLTAVGAVVALLAFGGVVASAALSHNGGTAGSHRLSAQGSPLRSSRVGHRSTTVPPTAPPPPATTTTTLPPPPPEPGGGQTLFPSHRLVAYYGAPADPTLGVLGTNAPEALWPQVASAAASYATPGTVTVPSYELIAFAAQAAPGTAGTYSAQIPASQIDSYQQTVQSHGGMLILDLQPGRSNFLAEAEALEPWLILPDVGLALDPEWELQPGQLPDQQIGHTTAAEINQVAAWLQQLTVSHGLPQKLLLVHQFQAAMIPDKSAVIPQPNLAIAFNMDGFGGTANKESVYRLLATDARWPLGYKLFFTRDQPLQTPGEVLALQPPPLIIDYE